MSFDEHSTVDEVVRGHDLTGKEVIVTGGAAGLGQRRRHGHPAHPHR